MAGLSDWPATDDIDKFAGVVDSILATSSLAADSVSVGVGSTSHTVSRSVVRLKDFFEPH